MENNRRETKPETKGYQSVMEEKLSEFLINQIHDAKGNDKNPSRDVSREKLLEEAVEKGIIKEKKEEFIEIEEKNFEKILEKISKEYKKQFKGKDLEDRENWLDYLYDDFGKNRGWIKDVEKEIKDGQMKTGLRGKIGLEEQIKKIIEEKIEEKAKEKKLRK